MCDDSFGPEEADLACRELNYTEGAICYANGPFPRSGGSLVIHELYGESYLLILLLVCQVIKV